MSDKRKPLLKRIAPSYPYTLDWQDADGTKHSRSFLLAYDLNAFSLVEEKLGVSPTTDSEALFLGMPSVRTTTVLLWAALRLNHKDEFGGDEGLESVGSILTLEEIGKARDACWEAYLGQLTPERAKKFRDAIAGVLAALNAKTEAEINATKDEASKQESPLSESPSAASV